LIYDSSPHISDNDISENTRSGITCCGASYPHIKNNQVYGHTQSGINMRDNSKGLVYNNSIFSNFYQVSTRAYSNNENKKILYSNKIEGDCEFSQNCLLF
jgi:parallel beta-helix repeat protein